MHQEGPVIIWPLATTVVTEGQDHVLETVDNKTLILEDVVEVKIRFK